MLTIAEYMCGVSNKIHSVHAKQIPFLLVCRHSAHILLLLIFILLDMDV